MVLQKLHIAIEEKHSVNVESPVYELIGNLENEPLFN